MTSTQQSIVSSKASHLARTIFKGSDQTFTNSRPGVLEVYRGLRVAVAMASGVDAKEVGVTGPVFDACTCWFTSAASADCRACQHSQNRTQSQLQTATRHVMRLSMTLYTGTLYQATVVKDPSLIMLLPQVVVKTNDHRGERGSVQYLGPCRAEAERLVAVAAGGQVLLAASCQACATLAGVRAVGQVVHAGE